MKNSILRISQEAIYLTLTRELPTIIVSRKFIIRTITYVNDLSAAIELKEKAGSWVSEKNEYKKWKKSTSKT